MSFEFIFQKAQFKCLKIMQVKNISAKILW